MHVKSKPLIVSVYLLNYEFSILGCSGDEGEGGGEEGPKVDEGEVSEEEPEKRSYFLREHKPRTQLFEAGERG